MNSKIIVALDYSTGDAALDLARKLQPQLCKLKVGKELFTAAGPTIVSELVDMGFDVFLDLKFHDIPNTVAKACQVASKLGVWMINIHASGGRDMMIAAREAVDQQFESSDDRKPLLIAVTVLTSISGIDLRDIGIDAEPEVQVIRLARLAQQCGIDGVVCSPLEITALRKNTELRFKLVTPGVRPVGADQNDQKRTMTPTDAIQAGADYLVVGRPISEAKDALQALLQINSSIIDGK